MAITPLLEKMILNGWAKYNTFSHALGAYSSFDIPDGEFIVVTDIIYYPFLNQHKDKYSEISYNDFFSLYNEYQLRIYNDSSSHIYQYRNALDVVCTAVAGFDLTQNMEEAALKRYFLMQPKAPIILDTYLTFHKRCNMLVTRNTGTFKVTATRGALNSYANEKVPITGIAGESVLLNAKLEGTTAIIAEYQPPNFKNTSVTTNTNYINSYQQKISKRSDPNLNSMLLADIGTGNGNQIPKSQYLTTPLITIGYVSINKNYFDKLQQS